MNRESPSMSLKMNKTEMRDYLTGKGFWIYDKISSQTTTYTKIEWNGIKAGYLLNDDVRLSDDTEPRRARLISVPYTHPRCLERVDRIILYLKTADRRRESRMRRERANQVREYFKSFKESTCA